MNNYISQIPEGIVIATHNVELFRLDPKVASAAITLLMTIFSYISHNRFSFRIGR